MSTDYTETLKRIKETEEATNREILAKRKSLEEELRKMEDAAAVSIAEAKSRAEALIADEVEKARAATQKAADSMNASAEKETKQIGARKLDKAALKKIIDQTILSEFK